MRRRSVAEDEVDQDPTNELYGWLVNTVDAPPRSAGDRRQCDPGSYRCLVARPDGHSAQPGDSAGGLWDGCLRAAARSRS